MKLYLLLFNILLLFGCTEQAEEIEIKTSAPLYLFEEKPNAGNVKRAIDFYELMHPDIVFAQAVLETGYFESNVCKEYNNLFGLFDSRNNDYYRFSHWSQSVLKYRDYVQYKYNSEGDYMEFLEQLPYAESPDYVKVLKQLIK